MERQRIILAKSNNLHNRVPLKAISNVIDSPLYNGLVCDINKSNNLLQSRIDPVSNLSTPLVRIKSKSSNVKTKDYMSNLLKRPLRTSSQCSDIRRHFPVRGQLNLSNNVKSTNLLNESPKCQMKNYHDPLIISPIKLDLSQKRTNLSEITSECDSKYPRLTMGSDVKYHPRYFRRKSFDTNSSIRTTPTIQLGPICSVPMPKEIPIEMPIQYSSLSLPWQTKTNISTYTVETQTSPIEIIKNRSPRLKSKHGSSFRGRSSSTTQVLQSLRRRFGYLRRAISADRLNGRNETEDDMKSDSKSLNDDKEDSLSNEHKDGIEIGRTKPSALGLTCQITHKYSDGSIRISMRRSSASEQLGFFIARDSRGIFISRMGSVKTTAKFWDIIRVGDRILEVQNVVCKDLEIEEVQNLIRGCELVHFRIKHQTSIKSLIS